jgi:hypothetical protein
MLVARVVLALPLLFCIACSDDPAPPSADAAATADAAANQPDAMPGAAIGYLQPCDTATDLCDATMNLQCFAFNNKGPHCTHSCTGNGDCEAPSTGCSGMNVCKVP